MTNAPDAAPAPPPAVPRPPRAGADQKMNKGD